MSEFKVFGDAVRRRFEDMSQGELYVVDATDLWASYLAAFPEGTDPIFRTRTEHDCSCCKNFVRNVGGVVGLKEDGSYATVWDGMPVDLPEPYWTVAARLDELVRQLPIKGVYRTKQRSYGAESTHEFLGEAGSNAVRTWNHFSARIASRHFTLEPEEVAGRLNTGAQVMERSLRELSAAAVDTVLGLITDGQLYRGDEHRVAVAGFGALKQKYDALETAAAKTAFAWKCAYGNGGGFRNTVIGTLVNDISTGVPLEDAVKMFESKVAPHNYKRPKAIVTQRMVDEASATLRELGLEDSIERRHARLSDVSVNDVLWVDGAARPAMRGGLDGLLADSIAKQSKPHAAARLAVKVLSIDDFVGLVVPKLKSASLVLEPRHQRNLVSLTAPAREDTNTLFHWGSDIGWSYVGDVTDSVRERVKRAGGDVDAPLRVSLAWHNADDLDLHCKSPDGHVYFGQPKGHRTSGPRILDVDMNAYGPRSDTEPVENLSWRDPKPGQYVIFVNQFSRRKRTDVGFEIQFHHPGGTQKFTYDREVSGTITCLSFFYQSDGSVVNLSVNKDLVEGVGRGFEFWGVKTGAPVAVKTLTLSPNHAVPDAGIGAKHWFFILDGCLNPEPVRGIYNEFLRPSLLEHKRVFELLGAKTKAPFSPDQMSGVGFTKGRGDSVIVDVRGDGVGGLFDVQF